MALLGETGTGKELAAKAVHLGSSRAGAPFAGVNCPGIVPLIQSLELFGRVKGAVNPQDEPRTGILSLANGGVILFDEFGDLEPTVQAALLRALEERKFKVIGGKEVSFNARIVAATSKDFSTLRKDLQERLKVRVELPALRDIPEDIPLLARAVILKRAGLYADVQRFLVAGPDGRMYPRMSGSFVQWLVQQPLRGNMRELERILIEAMKQSTGNQIRMPGEWESDSAGANATPPQQVKSTPPPSTDKGERQGRLSKTDLLSLLVLENWNVMAVARKCNVSHTTVQRWMKALDLERESPTP